jgi:cation diffusion facilitator CzcD-associated flavoprotein CzcO
LHCDATILGAGPYGLAAAAHLQGIKGLEVRAFGDPMWFWKSQMPVGMLLRSSWEASYLWDPQGAFGLNAYQVASGNHLSSPVSLERFVSYGLWFQQQAVPNLDRRKINNIELDPKGFRISLEDGDIFTSRRVVIAAGIFSFAWRPSEFDGLSSEMVSHSSEHRDLGRFADKKVVVVGGGQSALESAALLHERGADVEVIVRSRELKWLGWKKRIQSMGPISKVFYSWTDVGPAIISQVVSAPGLLQQFPRGLQDRFRKRSIRPAGAFWLLDRLKGVPLTTGRKIVSAHPVGDRLRLSLDDGSDRVVDHVLLGTGYRIDVSRYSFLSQDIVQKVQRTGGFPQLGPGFECSVPGLHFLGAPAAWSYGPLMYFVSGTKYAARKLTQHFSANFEAHS